MKKLLCLIFGGHSWIYHGKNAIGQSIYICKTCPAKKLVTEDGLG